MSFDILFDLIKDFCNKGEISESQMELLREHAKPLQIPDEELRQLINEAIKERNLREAQIKRKVEEETKRKDEEEKQNKILEGEKFKKKKLLKGKLIKVSIGLVFVLILIIVIVFTIKYYNQENLWKQVKQTNSSSSYQEYINQYPNGKYFSEAINLQIEAAWLEAKQENTIQGYDKYFSIDKEGKYKSEALLKREDAFWNEIKTKNTINGFNEYVNAYPEGRYKNQIWGIVSSLIPEYKKLGTSNFLILYNVIEHLNLSNETKKSEQYLFAFALKSYLDGAKDQALSTFKNISDQSPNTTEGKFSAQIISLPKTGTINFNTPPFHFKGTWKNFSGNEGVMIQLLKAEISNSISLTFSITAMNQSELLFYHPIYQKTMFNEEWFPPYIQDDLGVKFNMIGLTGGRQEKLSSISTGIHFNPHEQININIRFPLISAGATSIKFYWPKEIGHQGEWYWDNIKLKEEPIVK
jgi:hypothetical protein